MPTSFPFRLSARTCFYMVSAVIFSLFAGLVALFMVSRNDEWLISRMGGDPFVYTLDGPGHWKHLVMPRPGDSISIELGDPVTKRHSSFWTQTPGVSIVPIPLVSKTGQERKWWKTVNTSGGIENTWTEHYHIETYYPFRKKIVGKSKSETHVPDREVQFIIADDLENAWPAAGQPVSFTCSAAGYTEKVTFNVFPASVDPERIGKAADDAIELPMNACILGAMLCTVLLGVVFKTDKSGIYWRWPRR